MDQTAELLINELASSIVRKEMQVTEDQKTLGIPSPLVYIVGLLLCSKNLTSIKPPFPVELQDRFLELQKLYYSGLESAKGNDHKTYHLSPRLLPSKSQLALVENDFKAKLKELEVKANVMANQLMKLDQVAVDKKNKKHNKKQTLKGLKQRNANRKSDQNQNTSTQRETEKGAGETLQDLINMQIKREEIHESSDDSGSWVTIQSKNKSGKVQSQNHEIEEGDNLDLENENERRMYSSTPEEKKSIITSPPVPTSQVKIIDRESNTQSIDSSTPEQKKRNITSPLVRTVQVQIDDRESNAQSIDSSTPEEKKSNVTSPLESAPEDNIGELETEGAPADEIKTAPKRVIPSTRNDQKSSSDHTGHKFNLLQEHIKHLEMQLVEKDQQLLEERQMNFKSTRKLKEGYEDQIQALQMRLYISETRLRNYQDALEQHIQTVANNVPGA